MVIPDGLLRIANLSHMSVPLPGQFQGTGADRDAAMIKRVLEVLEHNRMIEFTPPESWSEMVELDPQLNNENKGEN